MPAEIPREMSLVGVAEVGGHRCPARPVLGSCADGELRGLDDAPPTNHERWTRSDVLVEEALGRSHAGTGRGRELFDPANAAVMLCQCGNGYHLTSFVQLTGRPIGHPPLEGIAQQLHPWLVVRLGTNPSHEVAAFDTTGAQAG